MTRQLRLVLPKAALISNSVIGIDCSILQIGLEGDNRVFHSNDRFVGRSGPWSPLSQPKVSEGWCRKLKHSDRMNSNGHDVQRTRPSRLSATYCKDSQSGISLWYEGLRPFLLPQCFHGWFKRKRRPGGRRISVWKRGIFWLRG